METEFFSCEKVMPKVEINILLVTRKRDENRSEIFISSGRRDVERTDINIKIDSFKSIRKAVSIPLLCRFPNFSPPFFLRIFRRHSWRLRNDKTANRNIYVSSHDHGFQYSKEFEFFLP